MIKANHLGVKFTKEFHALCDVDVCIETGEKVALVGEDGSGKTTFLRVISKLQKPSEGEVYLHGIALKRVDFKTDLSLGYLPVTPVFDARKNVAENLKSHIGNGRYSKYELAQRVDEALCKFGLQKLEKNKIRDLTLFQKYLLSFVRLSFRQLDVLLIDNIFKNLSNEEQEMILQIINEYASQSNLTMVVATSSNEIASKISSRQIYFNQGRIENEKNVN